VKIISETKSLENLVELKSQYRSEIQTKYEPRAKNCLACDVQGSCCVDEHFVNVHITKLEAVAALKSLQNLDEQKRKKIFEKVGKTIEKYDLKETGDTFSQTFACPLYDKEAGCLIHSVKPVPCIQHACYEKKEDLPPDELQTAIEAKIERLNLQTYRNNFSLLPLPLWIGKLNK
jgi:hypothetical protein